MIIEYSIPLFHIFLINYLLTLVLVSTVINHFLKYNIYIFLNHLYKMHKKSVLMYRYKCVRVPHSIVFR